MVDIKILATIGPSSLKESVIKDMDKAGVDLFRINLSHTRVEDFEDIVNKIRQWTLKPICLDTEGAQIRTGKFEGGQAEVKKNSVVSLVSCENIGNEKTIPLYPLPPAEFLKAGDILYLDFNQAIIQVLASAGGAVTARVLMGGTVGSNKGVHLDKPHSLPAFTKKDLKAFELASKLGISFISLSFSSKAEDVRQARSFFNFYPIKVISKIENRPGVLNLAEICKESDGILIDRGDLSRDVPLSKIGLVQNQIIKEASKQNTPVYVATNLLESMLSNFQPTRAEVNDITNTLLSGAKGLVLAAETAIGNHPVETTRMATSIMAEVEKYKEDKEEKYFNSIYEYNLIEPHGGVLVQNYANPSDIKNLENFPKIDVSVKVMFDAVQIADGVYSPIQGFMGKDDLYSVLEKYKLLDNNVWTLPILFQLKESEIKFKEGDKIVLRGQQGNLNVALMDVSEIKKINLDEVSQKWFGTADIEHPGVKAFKESGDHIIAGKVYLIESPFSSSILTPKQTREIFKNCGWKKIVGFHTRNVIHRGHEFIQKKALELVGADALFISPVIGPKKKDDFTAHAIIQSYDKMIESENYKPYNAIVGPFATYSRYSGPREAVFTALCRKNFGCSHFIIGRDHTGVGDYYPADASQKIFDKIGDIGIKPIMFDAVYFCKECNEVKTECSHGPDSRIKLSATAARSHLLSNEQIPEYLMRPEIANMLFEMKKDPAQKMFEG